MSAPLVVARDGSALSALERDWRELHAASPAANPFLTWEWQQGWAATHPADLQPLVVAAPFPDGRLAGILALQLRRHRGLRQLEFLAQGGGGDELDCLLHPAAPPDTAVRLLRAALATAAWDLLRLESARDGGALAPLLAGEPGETLPYLPLPADFETLLRDHSPNFRAEIRRRRRQFARLAPGYRLRVAESPAAVAEALRPLMQLHNQRRRQRAGAGIFEDAAICRFHLRVAPRLAAAGAARVYQLVCAEAVIAVLYGLCAGGRFFYFQSGFDPAWTGASPGTVLLSHLLEDCIARGERGFEFLRGNETYKRRWTSARRHSLCLRAQRGLLGGLYGWARAWRRARAAAAEAA